MYNYSSKGYIITFALLREKYPNFVFFCIFPFFHTYTEYGDLKSKFLYPVRVRKHVGHKIWSKFGYFYGPFFSLLRLCTEIYSVNICI